MLFEREVAPRKYSIFLGKDIMMGKWEGGQRLIRQWNLLMHIDILQIQSHLLICKDWQKRLRLFLLEPFLRKLQIVSNLINLKPILKQMDQVLNGNSI